MKDHGVSGVKVASLKFDAADIAKRQKQPHVAELAKSIEAGGNRLINPLTIQHKTRVVLAGRDRLAAVMLLGLPMVDAHQVDADAKEAARIERHENLYRRPVDRDKLLREESEEVAKTIAAEKAAAPKPEPPKKGEKPGKATPPTPKAKGRPKTAKGEAREAVAKKAGTTSEAVRKAEARAKKADEKAAKPEGQKRPGTSLPNLGVNTFGLSVSDDYAAGIETVCRGLDVIERQLTAAQGSVTKLEMAIVVGDVEAGALPRLKQMIHDAAALARGLQPKMLCPYCKDPDGKAGRSEECRSCDDRGYLSESKAQGIPPELLVAGEHAMVSDGKTGFVPLHHPKA